jgi:hypothetical protein
VQEICRKLGVSQATFFRWMKCFGSLGVRRSVSCVNCETKTTSCRWVADLNVARSNRAGHATSSPDISATPHRDVRLVDPRYWAGAANLQPIQAAEAERSLYFQ